MMSVHKIIHEFDPFGWIERVVPAQWLYRTINACMFVVVLGFLFARIRQYDSFAFKLLWAAETALFIVLAIAFGTRRDPIERSRGFTEIVIPLIGSALPFGLLFTQPSGWILESDVLLNAVFFWMTLATGFTAWSMWVLRRSFSITVEARELVTSGPYQWVRHPVYLGEIFAAGAVVAWRWSLVNVALFILFVVIQLVRARREEEKLMRTFVDYHEFVLRSWWVWKKGSSMRKNSLILVFVLLVGCETTGAADQSGRNLLPQTLGGKTSSPATSSGVSMRVMWTVSEYKLGANAVWSKEEADKLLFKPLDITANAISFDGKTCENVVFAKETVNTREYLGQVFHATPQTLGITAGTAEVVKTNCNLPGFAEYMRLNDRRLIININGVFFFFEPAVNY